MSTLQTPETSWGNRTPPIEITRQLLFLIFDLEVSDERAKAA